MKHAIWQLPTVQLAPGPHSSMEHPPLEHEPSLQVALAPSHFMKGTDRVLAVDLRALGANFAHAVIAVIAVTDCAAGQPGIVCWNKPARARSKLYASRHHCGELLPHSGRNPGAHPASAQLLVLGRGQRRHLHRHAECGSERARSGREQVVAQMPDV